MVRMGGASPQPFTLSTIRRKVVVYAPTERADTLPLLLFLLYSFLLCGCDHRVHTERQLPLFGVHSIMMEKLS
jgi:hypothetical protein